MQIFNGYKRWHGQSPKRIVDEMEHVVNEYGVNTFFYSILVLKMQINMESKGYIVFAMK